MARFSILFLILAVHLCGQSALRIRITEGEGVTYPAGSRATRGLTVLVTDENGRAVPEAVITFRLPDDGPSGTFSAGGRTEMAITGADGLALVWGMQWNRQPGPVEIRITAIKGEARAGIVTQVFLSEAREEILKTSGGHKKLWIALAAVGATVAAVAASSGSASGGTAPPAATAPRIGTPTIVIGRP